MLFARSEWSFFSDNFASLCHRWFSTNALLKSFTGKDFKNTVMFLL
jgi:hypothetical protein